MRRLVPALAVCALASCTLGNTIDVCSRKSAPERDLNGKSEGSQMLPTRNAAGPLPSGEGMAVWISQLTGQRPEVRGARISSNGSLLKTCDATGGGEFTYSVEGHYADQVALAPPPATDQLGAVVYRRHRLGDHDELWVVPITASGCPMQLGEEPQPFALEVAAPGSPIETPSAVSLPDGSIVVTWTEFAGSLVKAHVLARRFKLPGAGRAPQFLPTALSANGDAADAVALNADHANGVLTPLADGAALAFFDLENDGFRVELVRYDAQFAPKWGPLVLEDRTIPTGLVPDDISLNLAHDANGFLVGWMTGDLKLQPVVEGIFVDDDGRFLSAPRAPQGGPFRLGNDDGATEGALSIVGTGGGGFLAAWQESGTMTHPDRDGFGLRAVGFDGEGAVRFSNRTCEATDFQLNAGAAGDQTQPALTVLTDGTVLALWDNVGGDTNDHDGTGLKVVSLSLKDLFPAK